MSDMIVYSPRYWLGAAGGYVRNLAIWALGSDPRAIGVATAGHPTGRAYPDIQSMSAMGAFPWVRACVLRVASDLGARPVVVERRTSEGWEEAEDHPFLAMLRDPGGGEPGTPTDVTWSRQRVVDLALTGNAYAWIQQEGTFAAMPRLHPSHVKAEANPWRITGYKFGQLSIPVEEMLHTRGVSWSDDLEALLGEGAIRALHEDLSSLLAAKRNAAKAAARGQPDVAISPADSDIIWDDETALAVVTKWELNRAAGLGAVAIGSAVNVEQLQWSPREMEFSEQAEETRRQVLAVFGVPPVMLGLETANFATAREQKAVYWEARISDAAVLDAADTEAAQRMTPGVEIRVRRTFDDIEVLQESRTERQSRVLSWTLLGVPVAEAARSEGFNEIAVALDDQAAERDERIAAGAASASQAATALNGAQVASLLQILDAVSVGRLSQPGAIAMILAAFSGITEDQAKTMVGGAQAIEAEAPPIAAPPQKARALELATSEADRLAAWESWIERVHDPAETRMRLVMSRFLRAQAERYAIRAGTVLAGVVTESQQVGGSSPLRVLRALTVAQLDAILAETVEAGELDAAATPELLRIVAGSIEAAQEQLDIDGIDLDPDVLIPDLVDPFVADVGDVTSEMVRQIVETGLNEGRTIAEIQTSLVESSAFTPGRALRIARTETTKAISAGTLETYQAAEDQLGLTISHQWLSARDGVVRDSHVALDGQTVRVGDPFTVPAGVPGAGSQGDGPGLFRVAALDINCRCATIPIVE